MAIRAWRATARTRAVALLVASMSSLGCLSKSGSDGGQTRGGMTTVVRDSGSDDAREEGRAPDASRAADVVGRTGPDRADGGSVDIVADVSPGGADASADAAGPHDADSPDAVDAGAPDTVDADPGPERLRARARRRSAAASCRERLRLRPYCWPNTFLQRGIHPFIGLSLQNTVCPPGVTPPLPPIMANRCWSDVYDVGMALG